jgi:uncharacterized protein
MNHPQAHCKIVLTISMKFHLFCVLTNAFLLFFLLLSPTTSSTEIMEQESGKYFVSPAEMYKRSFELAHIIYERGFRPTWIVALWRGGAPVGMCVQEYFKRRGVDTNHIAIRTSSYSGQTQSRDIEVFSLNYIVKTANSADKVLIVDDIYDSGRSVAAVIDKMKLKMRANMPLDVRVATLFYKPLNNKTLRTPDYYTCVTDKWVNFPHELEDLNFEEMTISAGIEVANQVLVVYTK